jgi:hypothetical protein
MSRKAKGHQVLTVFVVLLFFGSLLVLETPKAKALVTQIVWSSDQVLSSNTTINQNEELFIKAGVKVLLDPGVSLLVYGNITVDGKVPNHVIFDWHQSGKYWGNLTLLQAPRRSHFNYANISHGINGILSYGSNFDADHMVADSNRRSGINASDCDIAITNSDILLNGPKRSTTDSGIYLDNVTGHVNDNTIHNNNNGMFIKEGSTIHVYSNIIWNSTSPEGAGILVRSGSSPVIERNDVCCNYNGFVGNASKTILKNNSIQQNQKNGALLVNGDASLLDNNAILYNSNISHLYTDGLEINSGSTPVLRNNQIMFNDGRGIYVNGAKADLTKNWISDNNLTGLMVANRGNVTTNGDNISKNSKYGITVAENSKLNSNWMLVENNNVSGIWVNGSVVTLHNLTIHGSNLNIQATNGSKVYIENGSGSNPKDHNLEIINSNITTLNFTMTGPEETWGGSHSSLLKQWYLGIKVLDKQGKPNPGVSVNLTPARPGPVVKRVTNGKGEVNWVVLNETFLEYSSPSVLAHNDSPYDLKVTFGKNSNSTSVKLDKSRNVTMVLGRKAPPKLIAPFTAYSFPENTNAYGLVNCTPHFSGDGPLTYSFKFQQNVTKLLGKVNGSKLDFFPLHNWSGYEGFIVRATDEDGQTVDGNGFNVTVTPLPVNSPPHITSTDVLSVYLGETYNYHVTASDPDGDPLTLTLDLGPQGLTLSNWNLTWTPNATQLGQHPVALGLSDGKNPAVHHFFNITVHPKNRPPTVKILTPANGAAFIDGDTIHFKGNASDPDNNPMAYNWKVDNTVSSTSLNFDTTLSIGTHKISFAVSDGKVTAYDNITISVKAKPPSKHYTTYVDNFCLLIIIVIVVVCIVADLVYRKFRP